jgi:hypothetical protein
MHCVYDVKFGFGSSKFVDPLEVGLKPNSNNEHMKTYTRLFAHLELKSLNVYLSETFLGKNGCRVKCSKFDCFQDKQAKGSGRAKTVTLCAHYAFPDVSLWLYVNDAMVRVTWLTGIMGEKNEMRCS